MFTVRRAYFVVALVLLPVVVGPVTVPAAEAVLKSPVAVGYLGAVSSIDAAASAIGIRVLRQGGNAVDAAVATAAALGVTDPFSAGIGGGGFLVYYDARTHRVRTVDGRETAPSTADESLFIENGKELPFDEAVTSGLSVGVPGTPATWRDALRKWGTRSLAEMLRPAAQLARRGFGVDKVFHDQVAGNAKRFAVFPATRSLYLPGGEPPAVGSVFTNPDLAATYDVLATQGIRAFYHGRIAGEIANAVRRPPVDPASGRIVRAGRLSTSDIAAYRTVEREPVHSRYRGLDVYGVPAPSAGGLTVAESLNILEDSDLAGMSQADYLHHFLEATRLAFADRNRWIGDPRFVDVPAKALVRQRFGDDRACLIDPARAAVSPVGPGDPTRTQPCDAGQAGAREPREGANTTHLTVADRWGNVVAYTLSIEREGGNGMVVPGRGFLLNNELTDFSFTPVTPGLPDPNLPGPSKRPRSSMAPTIVLSEGEPVLAVGSPGGASIITTVLQVLAGRLDRGLSLVDAIAAPRASQRNFDPAQVEQAFLDRSEAADLRARGQRFSRSPNDIGAVTGVERLPDGRWLAAAEPARRGGGSARVVWPSGR